MNRSRALPTPSAPTRLCRRALLRAGLFGWLAWLALLGSPALAREPGVATANLLVEFRWVPAGSSDGEPPESAHGSVAGTAAPAQAASLTARAGSNDASDASVWRRILVANGEPFRVSVDETRRLQWVDAWVDVTPRTPGTSASTGGPGAPTPAQIHAVPSAERQRQTQSLEGQVSWPGGSAPARLKVVVVQPRSEGDVQTESRVMTTVRLAMGRWTTIAAADPAGGMPGNAQVTSAQVTSAQVTSAQVTSTRGASETSPRDLQVRVSLRR